MRWSDAALKGTLGSGGLGVLAVWIETVEPFLNFWVLFAAVMLPFIVLLFIKIDEVAPALARFAHTFAVIWYLMLVLASAVLIAFRGPQRTDLLFAFFMLIGMIPCVLILRGLFRGDYRTIGPVDDE